MYKLIAAVALATALASPAFAQSYDPDLGTGNIAPVVRAAPQVSGAQAAFARVAPAPAQVGSPAAAFASVPSTGLEHADPAAREKSLRECSTLAGRYTQTTWGGMQLHLYRTCMVEHGQAE